MCSYQEWEGFARRAQELIDEDRLSEFVAHAVAKLEVLVEELKGFSCAPEPDWAAGRRRGSRPEWVA